MRTACGVPITKVIRAQLKKLIRRNKTRADFAAKFEGHLSNPIREGGVGLSLIEAERRGRVGQG